MNNNIFSRTRFLKEIEHDKEWDMIIIGGGATGLGTALDAAERGYSVLLLEQSDFAKGTSSRSTKLVHGGVRYLAQGNIGLVYDALNERGLLLKNAPHLVKIQSFIIPCYNWVSKIRYLTGLKIYDWLSGKSSFGNSKLLSKQSLLKAFPNIKSENMQGGIQYWDGQFDDARLAINIAQTCAEKGGALINYIKVKGLKKSNDGKINGVVAYDLENNREYWLKSKVVINATGIFVDEILQMDIEGKKPLVRPSQGVHLVLSKSFLPGDNAVMIPETTDGRVLFAIPWHDHTLLGTTDTPLEEYNLEPIASDKEIDFILKTAGQYLTPAPVKKDVLSVFAGLRPLAAPDKNSGSTKEISRSHKLIVNASGLITITGGKWTTYRKMAEDTVNIAIKTGRLPFIACNTKNLKIHGYTDTVSDTYLSVYGTDELKISELINERPALGDKIIACQPYLQAEVIWSTRYEMARTVEDILARRLRILFLNALDAIKMTSVVANLMANELGYTKEWEFTQVADFTRLANQYLIEVYQPESKHD